MEDIGTVTPSKGTVMNDNGILSTTVVFKDLLFTLATSVLNGLVVVGIRDMNDQLGVHIIEGQEVVDTLQRNTMNHKKEKKQEYLN